MIPKYAHVPSAAAPIIDSMLRKGNETSVLSEIFAIPYPLLSDSVIFMQHFVQKPSVKILTPESI